MVRTGLVDRINEAVAAIDSGRKGFAIIGKEREGRVSYEEGIAKAMSAFKEAQTSVDPEAIILSEYAFLSQELEFCDESDKDAFNSLTQGLIPHRLYLPPDKVAKYTPCPWH